MANGEEYVPGEIGGVYLPGFEKIDDGRRLVYKFVDVVGKDRKANFGDAFKQGAGTLDGRPDILALAEGREYHESQRPPREFPVYNARLIQEAHTGTLEEFFEHHGFVLLQHETAVTDWGDAKQFKEVLRQIFLLVLSPFRSTDLFGGAGLCAGARCARAQHAAAEPPDRAHRPPEPVGTLEPRGRAERLRHAVGARAAHLLG